MSAGTDKQFADPGEVLRLWYEKYYSVISASADGSFFERYML